MYNKKIRFDGDIIITDPCYIINKKNDSRFDENGNYRGPSWWDFLSMTTTTEVDDGKGGTWTRYNIPKPTDYPDCREMTSEDYRDETEKLLDEVDSLLSGRRKKMFSPTMQAEWDAYHKAEEEWDSVPHDDWDRCDCGDNMEALGITTYLSDSTIYGDWSCTVFDDDTKEKIGTFCADSGTVGVFLLSEVLKYNPDFDYHTERTWTTALIKDFHGTVMLKMEDDTVSVVGEGNVNFTSFQTGL